VGKDLKGGDHLVYMWMGDIIEIDLKEIGWEDVDWTYLGQDGDQWQALVNTVMNLWVP
jgi:hypothetical protein